MSQVAESTTSALLGEFHFTDRDFQRTRRMIYAIAGISLAESKRQMVYTRLARRLRTLDIHDVGDYLDKVEREKEEEQHFINALTTNLTSFFRENHHFEILAERLRKIGGDREITIWCAAASSGEEPYSIAITAFETLGAKALHHVKIVASDLDTRVLKIGIDGVYPIGALDTVPKKSLRACFMRGTGSQEGFARVRADIQHMVEFRQINLLDEHWPIQPPVDIIFCRNVMIYFDRQTQRRILERFAPMLTPDGLLFAGHSESLGYAHDLFHLLGKTVYQPAPARSTA